MKPAEIKEVRAVLDDASKAIQAAIEEVKALAKVIEEQDAIKRQLADALIAAMLALGRGGANIAGGPNRSEWEMARASLTAASVL